jgi:hypothetical protein
MMLQENMRQTELFGHDIYTLETVPWYPAKVFIFVGPPGAIRLNPIKIILFH